MYKKQLYKIALLSSPIIAAFEITPIFFLTKQPQNGFLYGMIGFTILTFIIWLPNIFVVSLQESKRWLRLWEQSVLSYSFTFLIVAFFFITDQFVTPNHSNDFPSPFLPVINIMSLNAIILIIANSIVANSKKNQTEKELAQLRIIHLETEQQQLIQQMQPHFLFNALSTLKSLIKKDAPLAEDYLIKLSDFLRYTVSAHEKNIIPLVEELQFTRDYIELQQIRFSGLFFCTISIPENILGRHTIPVYALETLVENTIKHNAFTEMTPLNVEIKYSEGYLVVSNNKIPKPQNRDNGGVGLKNLEKRYSALKESDGIVIRDSPSDFLVKIKLLEQK
jgi:two-component system, LytTR family, sensor kinase